MAEDDGPKILRPIPRRPFNVNFTDATPPDGPSSPDHGPDGSFGSRLLSAAWEKLGDTPGAGTSTISRPPSFMNLTTSTLYGIYSPTASKGDRSFGDRFDAETPWGTGAQTPIKRPSVDEATYELMRDRSHATRRRSSSKQLERAYMPGTSPVSIILRTGLLFVLGLGYGALVAKFQQEQTTLSTNLTEGIINPGYNLKYLAFWGVSGVVLGSLLPWFDSVWENAFGDPNDIVDSAVQDDELRAAAAASENGPATDWTLVMRAIGAFVGIVFAIRKLAWSSTLQISITLALVNPLLWWIIDRSKSGFLLSAFVGLVGSILLLGVNPEIMPTPTRQIMRNTTNTESTTEESVLLGGFAHQETIETGVWLLSVLFCSCVCFGNIGRRLTWGRTAVGKGRWADTQ